LALGTDTGYTILGIGKLGTKGVSII
jgi:hypothetical protein